VFQRIVRDFINGFFDFLHLDRVDHRRSSLLAISTGLTRERDAPLFLPTGRISFSENMTAGDLYTGIGPFMP
jgi:hypothetical protein